MLSDYAPILILFVLAAGFAGGNVILSEILGKRKPGAAKNSVYECGMPIRGSARARFSVHYYLVALLFILFDVEAAFLLPWAANARMLGVAGLLAMAGFLVILTVGFVYVIRKRALEWDR
ncbi:MAG: NADH-quinone oxidoreductase subunit A [Planctomycetes bacterium]|nr:NADH-quinone oxidoreductase subunit A [Planctomycetota bacterium]